MNKECLDEALYGLTYHTTSANHLVDREVNDSLHQQSLLPVTSSVELLSSGVML